MQRTKSLLNTLASYSERPVTLLKVGLSFVFFPIVYAVLSYMALFAIKTLLTETVNGIVKNIASLFGGKSDDEKNGEESKKDVEAPMSFVTALTTGLLLWPIFASIGAMALALSITWFAVLATMFVVAIPFTLAIDGITAFVNLFRKSPEEKPELAAEKAVDSKPSLGSTATVYTNAGVTKSPDKTLSSSPSSENIESVADEVPAAEPATEIKADAPKPAF